MTMKMFTLIIAFGPNATGCPTWLSTYFHTTNSESLGRGYCLSQRVLVSVENKFNFVTEVMSPAFTL